MHLLENTDVLIEIFYHLPSLFHIAQVCRSWYQSTTSQTLWKKRYCARWLDIIGIKAQESLNWHAKFQKNQLHSEWKQIAHLGNLGVETFSLDTLAGEIWNINWSSDGKFLVMSGEHKICFYEVDISIVGGARGVTSITRKKTILELGFFLYQDFSPDGCHVALMHQDTDSTVMVYNLSNFGCLSFPAIMQQQWDFIGRWINSKEVITDYELRKISSENEIHVLTVHHIHTKRKRMLEIPATKICGKFRIPSVDHVNNKMVCFAGLEVSDHVAFTELGPDKEISLNLHKTDGYLIGNTLSRDGNQALIVKRKFDKLQPDLLHIGAGLSNLICLELWDVKSQKNLQSYYGPEAVVKVSVEMAIPSLLQEIFPPKMILSYVVPKQELFIFLKKKMEF